MHPSGSWQSAKLALSATEFGVAGGEIRCSQGRLGSPFRCSQNWLLQRGRWRINPAVTCLFKRSWGAIEKSVPAAVKSVIITEQRAPLSFSRQHPQEILLCNQGKRCNQAPIQASFRNSPCRQHKGFSMVLCEAGDHINVLVLQLQAKLMSHLSTSSVHLHHQGQKGPRRGVRLWAKPLLYVGCCAKTHPPHLDGGGREFLAA